MEQQTCWRRLIPSASQEISGLLWKSRIDCSVQNIRRLGTSVTQNNAVHNLPSCFLEIRFKLFSLLLLVISP